LELLHLQVLQFEPTTKWIGVMLLTRINQGLEKLNDITDVLVTE